MIEFLLTTYLVVATGLAVSMFLWELSSAKKARRRYASVYY